MDVSLLHADLRGGGGVVVIPVLMRIEDQVGLGVSEHVHGRAREVNEDVPVEKRTCAAAKFAVRLRVGLDRPVRRARAEEFYVNSLRRSDRYRICDRCRPDSRHSGRASYEVFACNFNVHIVNTPASFNPKAHVRS